MCLLFMSFVLFSKKIIHTSMRFLKIFEKGYYLSIINEYRYVQVVLVE